MSRENPQSNPTEFIRDLIVFAPLGALLIARDRVEEFLGEAIERGRSERAEAQRSVRNQVEIAKSLGRSRVHRAVGDVVARSEDAPFSAVRRVGSSIVQQAQEAAGDAVSQLPTNISAKSGRGVGQDVIRQAQERMGFRLQGERASQSSQVKPSQPTAPSGEQASSGHLAISDYESLSAAQINARLGGLTDGELDDLRSFEASHRGRKSILDRVEQELATRS